MKYITSLDSLEVGYYWLAVKGDTRPPRIVAVIRGPRGNALECCGVAGNFNAPSVRYHMAGPLAIPEIPEFEPVKHARREVQPGREKR